MIGRRALTEEELEETKRHVKEKKEEALEIMKGKRDNYSRTDAARYIHLLCNICETLIEELEEGE